MPAIRTVGDQPSVAQDVVNLPSTFPSVPDDVKARFPDMADYDDQLAVWWKKLSQSLSDSIQSVATVTNQVNTNTQNLTASFGEFKAEITTEISVIVDDLGAQATEIVTVSAMAGINGNISVQNIPPGGPALNDYWIDTSMTPATTKQWSGVAWVIVTTPISFAGVATEKTARVTADGFLSGKYTLTVIAGNVITGFNITSSTGGGSNVSNVSFTATSFNIYDGVTNFPIFTTTVGAVALAGTLVVSTSGKVFIGSGTFNNAGTPFYVDSSGNFSLGTKLTWNGTTLNITGSITATTGAIGGWAIAATTLTGGSAILDSTGQLILGTANNIVYLSATDATYRLWVGNVTAGSATFSVTKAGALFSTSGTIGGFTIGATTVTSSNIVLDSANGIIVTSNSSFKTWQGDAGINNQYYRHQTDVSGSGLAMLGVGSGAPLIYSARASGTFGAMSNYTGGRIINMTGRAYNGAGWDFVNRIDCGVIDAAHLISYAAICTNPADLSSANYLITHSDGKIYLSHPTSGGGLSGPIDFGGAAPYIWTPYANIYCSANGFLQTDSIFVVPNGGGAAPSITFAIDHTIGLSASAGQLSFSIGGSIIGAFTSTGLQAPIGQTVAAAGTFTLMLSGSGVVGAPGIAFTADTGTGIFLNAAGDMWFVYAGARVFQVRGSGTPKVICFQPLQLNNAYVAGAAACTGTVTLLDNGGNVLRVLVANP